MKHRVYPEYKPSGVSWLGEIPAHWDPVRLRYRAKINPIRSEINGLPGTLDVSFVPMESVHEYGGLSLDQSRPLAEVSTGYTYFRDGDVLAAKITPCFENGKGAIAHELMNGIGFGTTELHVLRPHPSMDRHFLFYVTISHAFRHLGAAEMYGAGGQKRVPEIFIRDFRQSIPPLKEQRAIAAFLDRETARIDALIGKKQRQIELLQEKRSALISHAVTRGLDPNAKMKDSGIEWLGEIPAHWEVKRLKRFVRLRSGESITAYEIDETGDYPVYGGNGLRGFTNSYNHNGTFVLIGRQGALCGCINYVTGYFWASEHAVVVSTKNNIATKWLGELLRSMKLNQYSQSAAQPGLAVETIAALFVPVPPPAEQCDIADFIDFETDKIDAMVRKVDKSITLLREHRTALISAAVTGKIDVRTMPAGRQEEVS